LVAKPNCFLSAIWIFGIRYRRNHAAGSQRMFFGM
jgi:hypothetical protein